jgi:hypothetical protein
MIIRSDNLPPMIRVVVGVDPPASSSGESALAGIVVAGLGVDRRGYVLADYSGRMSPGQWGRKVVEAYDRFRADRIIAEGNQGGEMVRHTIQTVRENVPVTIVHASRAKQARAEPVAALYEQGTVDHVGSFPELEDEMCTWEPLSGMPSPDRLDALVWALTELAIGGGPMVYSQAARLRHRFRSQPLCGRLGCPRPGDGQHLPLRRLSGATNRSRYPCRRGKAARSVDSGALRTMGERTIRSLRPQVDRPSRRRRS